MSDFLTNLVERSFAPAPDLLTPKLPSLFEAPTGSEPILEESRDMDTHEEIPEAAPVSPTVNRLRLEKYSTRVKERGTTLLTEPTPEAPERQRVTRQTILPFTPEESPRTPIKIQGDEHIIVASTLGVETRPNERKQAPGSRVDALTQSLVRSDTSESAPQGATPRVVPVLPKLEMHQPISESKNNMDAKLFSAEDRSSTVHIHIGRIEVRAVTQSSAPARPVVPNRPKMTLDEYLLRRNEGKR